MREKESLKGIRVSEDAFHQMKSILYNMPFHIAEHLLPPG